MARLADWPANTPSDVRNWYSVVRVRGNGPFLDFVVVNQGRET